MAKPKKKATAPTSDATAATGPAILLPFHDVALSAVFSDAESAGLAAESLVKGVLGDYGRRLGKVVSVTPQSYSKLPRFRGTRVDVVCWTDSKELWLVEFQMYEDEHMFERNLAELSYAVIRSTATGTTVEEMAEAIPHIVIINFLDFPIRGDNLDWLQPVHLVFDKEPRRAAYEKLEIFNVQLPWFAKHEPDFGDDGECWLYVMYQAHIKGTTPQEVIAMDDRLARFETTNPGFQQFETRFREACANPDLLDIMRMETSERMRQAGMIKAAEKRGAREGEKEGKKAGIKEGKKKGLKEGKKENAREVALRLLKDGIPLGKIAEYSGLTPDEVAALQAPAE